MCQAKITADGDCSHKIKRCLLLGRKAIDQPRQHIKKQRHYFANKGLSSQGYGFSSSHIWMWKLDYRESWAPKYWCFWPVVLERTLENPLDCKEIQPVHPKDQSWIFHWKDWCWSWNSNTLATWCKELTHLKRPWCWERLQAGGEGNDRVWDGWMASSMQWAWVWASSGTWWWTCCSPRGCKESGMTERLDWTELCLVCELGILACGEEQMINTWRHIYLPAHLPSQFSAL